MKITILTLFPGMFLGPFNESIIKRASDNKLINIRLLNIRDYGKGKQQEVDDTPYGGGAGMVLRVDVLHKAILAAKDDNLSRDEEKIVLMTADGKTFTQKTAISYSELKHLILICGHYEGVDERIREYVDDEVSIGDFVLTGGEIPAMLITDAVSRLVSGVLKKEVIENESHSLNKGSNTLLEYPLYTRPPIYNDMEVPQILLSGNHKEIKIWREKKAYEKTQLRRPDLLKK